MVGQEQSEVSQTGEWERGNQPKQHWRGVHPDRGGKRPWPSYVLASNSTSSSTSPNRPPRTTGSPSLTLKPISARTRTVPGNRTASVMAAGRRLRTHRWPPVLRGKTGVLLISLTDRNVGWLSIWGIACSWCNVNFLIYYKQVYLSIFLSIHLFKICSITRKKICSTTRKLFMCQY